MKTLEQATAALAEIAANPVSYDANEVPAFGSRGVALACAEYLLAVPTEQYAPKLGYYVLQEPCGTTACAAGHLVLSPLMEAHPAEMRHVASMLHDHWPHLFASRGNSQYDQEMALITDLTDRQVAAYRMFRRAGESVAEALRRVQEAA